MSDQGTNDPKAPALITAGAGTLAGGVTTSGAALTVAGGATGVTGYLAGIGVLGAHIGCETAAVIGLGTVAAGPIIGGLLGYGLYRGVKKMAKGY